MNHMHSQNAKLAAATAEIIALRNGLSDLIAYVQSPKFSAPDNYYNPSDIVTRAREIAGAADVAYAAEWRTTVCRLTGHDYATLPLAHPSTGKRMARMCQRCAAVEALPCDCGADGPNPYHLMRCATRTEAQP